MRLYYRILLSAAVGLIAATAGWSYFDVPVTTPCGGGGFEFGNDDGNNSSIPSQYGASWGENWNPGSSIAFTWNSTGNGFVTLTILGPGGQPVYSDTGQSGTGSFTANSGTYIFSLPPAPPVEQVSVNYQCTAIL
jgi:hypothetical protein